ncbi:alpha/beta fold hydrolase [Rhodococcoides kroppenstedtii]|uniref:alpha/beta fold hydrolase n=1 Tax=Rhodococcoides kroppenstedtii TaxID=293050 RepID=UPI00364055F4
MHEARAGQHDRDAREADSDLEIRRGTAPVGRGVELAYEDMGDLDAPPVLLVMGLGCQLLTWSMPFCRRLLDAGHRVIRFDNRDIGLSTKMTGERVTSNVLLRLVRHELGQPSSVPYTIVDMADDTIGLMDHLGLERAHIVGASMGGMITQVAAGSHPERFDSVTIIFSSTNQPFLRPPDLRALAPLLKPPPKNATREQIIEHQATTFQTIGGKQYATTWEERIADATAAYDRSYHPAGIVRQFAAITGTGSLLKYTRRITAPTAVIHGTADPLVPPMCGKAVAKAIPGARLTLLDGMGHDIPNELLDEVVGAITDVIARA